MKRHILLVLDYYLPHRGGVETVFEQVVSRLLKKGYMITLLTSRFDRALPVFEQQGDLRIVRTGWGRLSFMFFALLKGFSLLKKDKDISVIHASTYGGAIPASILGKIFKKRVVLTVHEVFGKLWLQYKGWFRGWMYLLFEKIIFLFPYSVYHCVSRYTMNALRLLYAVSDDKMQVIYNGVDTDFWSLEKVSTEEIAQWKKDHEWNGRYVVVYYGHAGISKGLDMLIHCLPQVVKHDPDILFVFNLIDSKRKNQIVNRLHALEKHGYARQIQLFDGMEKEVLRTFVAAADLVVAPSLSEGFGSVHTEAVALEKPLITTFVASIPEVVSGQVKFVQPGDCRGLFEAILDFQKGQHIEHMPAHRFDWDATVHALEQLY